MPKEEKLGSGNVSNQKKCSNCGAQLVEEKRVHSAGWGPMAKQTKLVCPNRCRVVSTKLQPQRGQGW